jgi:hypothetical protein
VGRRGARARPKPGTGAEPGEPRQQAVAACGMCPSTLPTQWRKERPSIARAQTHTSRAPPHLALLLHLQPLLLRKLRHLGGKLLVPLHLLLKNLAVDQALLRRALEQALRVLRRTNRAGRVEEGRGWLPLPPPPLPTTSRCWKDKGAAGAASTWHVQIRVRNSHGSLQNGVMRPHLPSWWLAHVDSAAVCLVAACMMHLGTMLIRCAQRGQPYLLLRGCHK